MGGKIEIKTKKRIRGIIAILMATSLFLTACGGGESSGGGEGTNNEGTNDGGGSDNGTNGGPSAGDMAAYQGVIDRAAELAEDSIFDEVFGDDFEVTDVIQWLSWFPIDPYSPTMETFKARFGTPAGADAPIERISVAYENRYSRLGTLINGGDSPDLFQFEERYWPWGSHTEHFQPVDNIIDFSRPEWDNTRDIMELFEWGGRNYTAITELTNSTAILFYRHSIAEGAGLEDPFAMWQRGDWTWDALLDMVSDFSETNSRWGITGFYTDEAAILSTGTGILTIEDGLLRNNLDDPRVERAMDFVRNLATNDFRYPYHILNDFALPYRDFRDGNVLFFNDGPWKYQEQFSRFARTDNWADDELRMVPFPRDPQADNDYIRGKQDALMFVHGSTNRDGFLAWTYSMLLAHQDDEMSRQTRARDKENFGWTDHHLDTLEELRDPADFTLVWDFKNGIGIDVACAVSESYVQMLTRPVIIEGEPFPGQREAHRGPIEARIREINERARDRMEAAAQQ
ncbi:MAG: extracellular solute-binding protein [Oscillospiraceae bacterium]|nr:extracellular solute-binding protein [Oscillospiraceae bacterium]